MDTEALLTSLALAAVAAYVIVVFNRLVARRNACSMARAGIDVNLTRRHDLIPNLVATVRGYAAHEQDTLQAVVAARTGAIAQLGADGSAAAEQQIEQSLTRLIARVEAYPQLKADGVFRQLMQNLTETEEQISASRRAFNGQVLRLNNLVEQFPTSIVAAVTGFRTLQPYASDQSAQTAPIVDLS